MGGFKLDTINCENNSGEECLNTIIFKPFTLNQRRDIDIDMRLVVELVCPY